MKDPSLQGALRDQNLFPLTQFLMGCDNTDRRCGAEINSITSIFHKGLLDNLGRLIFLVSDTDDGILIGKLLKQYYEQTSNSIRFKAVEYRVLSGLKDDDIHAFKQKGLRNLVHEISAEVRKFSAETIAINATGGYKAQISFAGMIGQALDIPVYYLFEKFSEVIELPPQPIALDLSLWLNHYLLFEQLETDSLIEKSTLTAENLFVGNNLEALLDQEEINGRSYVSLSAMGVLFHERSRLQFEKQKTTLLSLIPTDDTLPKTKKIHIRDDHGKDILEAFALKICHSPYVKSVINSLPFNPNMSDCIRRTFADGKVEFVLHWTDRGLGMCVQTTGRNLAETNSIALHLKHEYEKS
uniref:putative CRISPR-associated protein n=1 Tax=Petrachloros mirabilis TaxID=2918835 RepID=UPI001EE90705|nr:putative CRISPR-associated protein [Petrachloros mirabilis]